MNTTNAMQAALRRLRKLPEIPPAHKPAPLVLWLLEHQLPGHTGPDSLEPRHAAHLARLACAAPHTGTDIRRTLASAFHLDNPPAPEPVSEIPGPAQYRLETAIPNILPSLFTPTLRQQSPHLLEVSIPNTVIPRRTPRPLHHPASLERLSVQIDISGTVPRAWLANADTRPETLATPLQDPRSTAARILDTIARDPLLASILDTTIYTIARTKLERISRQCQTAWNNALALLHPGAANLASTLPRHQLAALVFLAHEHPATADNLVRYFRANPIALHHLVNCNPHNPHEFEEFDSIASTGNPAIPIHSLPGVLELPEPAPHSPEPAPCFRDRYRIRDLASRHHFHQAGTPADNILSAARSGPWTVPRIASLCTAAINRLQKRPGTAMLQNTRPEQLLRNLEHFLVLRITCTLPDHPFLCPMPASGTNILDIHAMPFTDQEFLAHDGQPRPAHQALSAFVRQCLAPFVRQHHQDALRTLRSILASPGVPQSPINAVTTAATVLSAWMQASWNRSNLPGLPDVSHMRPPHLGSITAQDLIAWHRRWHRIVLEPGNEQHVPCERPHLPRLHPAIALPPESRHVSDARRLKALDMRHGTVADTAPLHDGKQTAFTIDVHDTMSIAIVDLPQIPGFPPRLHVLQFPASGDRQSSPAHTVQAHAQCAEQLVPALESHLQHHRSVLTGPAPVRSPPCPSQHWTDIHSSCVPPALHILKPDRELFPAILEDIGPLWKHALLLARQAASMRQDS